MVVGQTLFPTLYYILYQDSYIHCSNIGIWANTVVVVIVIDVVVEVTITIDIPYIVIVISRARPISKQTRHTDLT